MRKNEEAEKQAHRISVSREVTDALNLYMRDQGISRTEIARRMGTAKFYTTDRVFVRTQEMTLRMLADILWALGAEVRVSILPKGAELSPVDPIVLTEDEGALAVELLKNPPPPTEKLVAALSKLPRE